MRILRKVDHPGGSYSGWTIDVTDDEMFNHMIVVDKVLRDTLIQWINDQSK